MSRLAEAEAWHAAMAEALAVVQRHAGAWRDVQARETAVGRWVPAREAELRANALDVAALEIQQL